MRSWRRSQRRTQSTVNHRVGRGPLFAAAAVSALAAVMFGSAGAASAVQVSTTGFSPSGGGWESTAAGTVVPFGGAVGYGSVPSTLNSGIVGMTSTPDGHGYWLVASDGGIFTFGDAHFYGSMGGTHLNKPIVGIAATPDGHGYWEVASDGGIFTFGDAHFYGSTGSIRLNQPIVGMVAFAGNRGYWLVARDGGVFTFGDAPFYGSTGSIRLNQPIVGTAATPDGQGYWLVASDGGIFTFGDARFYGSLGEAQLASPIVGVAPDSGHGYRLIAANGSFYSFSPGAPSAPKLTPAPAAPTTPLPPSAAPTTPLPSSAAEGTSGAWPSSLFALPLASKVSSASASPATSSAYTQDLVSDYQRDYGSVGIATYPIWTVGANQPTVTVSMKSGCNDFTPSTGTQIPIPANATTSGSGDSPLIIDQPSTHTEWELWQATPAGGGTWSACWGGKLSTATSQGVFPSPYGLSASGISYLATVITEADIASGAIDHAFAIQLPACNGQVAPADRSDCGNNPGQPAEGTWFRLPAGLAMPAGLTPFGQMVFKALQSYGMVVADQARGVIVATESPSSWNAQGHPGTDPITASWQGKPEYAALDGIPWNQLQVVTP